MSRNSHNKSDTVVVCTKCILDTTDDPEIRFDADGICNHCHTYEANMEKRSVYRKTGEEALQKVFDKIKRDGADKSYDCIIGLSGGVDSTYVAWLAKSHGLRPLAVHLDNGWNSELAVMNMQNILKRLDLDLYTYVINWKEFRDMQIAYFKAGVIDIEVLTDHAIMTVLLDVAIKNGVRYVLSGESAETEGILPRSWVHMKSDHINIKAIHDRFGSVKRKTFPLLSYWKFLSLRNKVEYVPILNYLNYDKKTAKETIIRDLRWRDYGGKHYESVFTRFYQSYILPVKFGVDKRKSHYSTLVCAGQITRDGALEWMMQPVDDPVRIQENKEYVAKKWGMSLDTFDSIMTQPPHSHMDYPSVMHYLLLLSKIKRFFFFWKKY